MTWSYSPLATTGKINNLGYITGISEESDYDKVNIYTIYNIINYNWQEFNVTTPNSLHII